MKEHCYNKIVNNVSPDRSPWDSLAALQVRIISGKDYRRVMKAGCFWQGGRDLQHRGCLVQYKTRHARINLGPKEQKYWLLSEPAFHKKQSEKIFSRFVLLISQKCPILEKNVDQMSPVTSKERGRGGFC